MIHGIDHIVIISPDLNQASANARAAGFTVVPGGTHADGLTHNALIAFVDGSYIELISPTGSADPNAHRWFSMLQTGGGLVDLCLLSDDLADDVARISQMGPNYVGPVSNGRARPDGIELKWKGAFPTGPVGESGLPFLIEDVTPRELRVPGNVSNHHENGACGIAGITVMTDHLAGSTEDFQAVTGQKATLMPSPFEETPLAAFITFEQSWIMLTQPTAGEALQRLEQSGRGPFAVTLRTHEGPISPGQGKRIDPVLMTGTVMDLD